MVPPPNPHISGVISLPPCHDALLVFLGFMQMPAFSQCEEEVREGTFMSLLRIEKGCIIWGLSVIKDEGGTAWGISWAATLSHLGGSSF